MRKIIISASIAILLSGPALADSSPPSHYCRKPHKPYSFSSQWEIDQFNDEVSRYKRCINEFVEQQSEEAKNHKEAAQEAIEEWNSFVRRELN